jgi:hypothetical protein
MGPRTGGPGPRVSAHGPHNSKMISVVQSVTKGSDFMKAKGNDPNLAHASEIVRRRAVSPFRAGGTGSPRWHVGRARWLAGVGVGMRNSLQFCAISTSNQSRGRGVLTKRYSENGSHWKMACGGKDSALALGNGGRELEGAISTVSWPNRCGIASTSSSGSRHGPKHR